MSATGPSRIARVRTRLSVAALVVVAAVTLAVGGGLGRSAPPTLSQRASALEAVIKCPSCEDISVAQSDAPTAVAARHQITRMLAAGASDAAIERSFVARYGPSILLDPPASGLNALVWVLPALGAAAALALVAVVFWRRQRALAALRATA